MSKTGRAAGTMGRASIYTLNCPYTGAIRYVGYTAAKELRLRLNGHISEARRLRVGHRGAWIRSLLASGLVPLIQHDVDVPAGADWRDVERERIAFHLANGAKLVNGTAGGEGLFNPSADVRARMSASARKRKYTEEGLRRLLECAKRTNLVKMGKKRRPETIAKIAAAKRGTKHTPEARAKMSAARRGKPKSAEWRAKVSAAHLRFHERKRAASIEGQADPFA